MLGATILDMYCDGLHTCGWKEFEVDMYNYGYIEL